MITLTNLTLNNVQQTTVLLADGTSLNLTFRYRPAIQRWTVDVSYPKTGFVCNGKMLSTHPNLFRLWRQVVPWGLQVSNGGLLAQPGVTDPFLPSDLAPGADGSPARITVVVLDGTSRRTDVDDVEAQYFAAGSPAAY